jgi:hypothetical protein
MSINGYAGYGIEQPYYVSQGLWTLTGNEGCAAFTPLKRTSTLVSGLWGVSGVAWVRLNAQVYDDISGISGCIGCNIEEMKADSETGLSNVNRSFARRNMAVLHLGVVKLPQVSGTLDGTPVTLKWGDAVAPCISGFRAFEEINYTGISGSQGNNYVNVLHTGVRQQVLGTYMDHPNAMTGTSGVAWRRIFMNPQAIYGVHK